MSQPDTKNEPAPAEAAPAPSAPAPTEPAPTEAAPCCCCNSTCEGCKPEAIQEKLAPHAKAVENIQAMIFWRRPIPMAIFLVCFETLLILIRVFDLGFLPVSVLLMAIRIVYQLVSHTFGDAICAFLFPELQEKGTAEEMNRIRSIEELSKHASCVCGTCKKTCSCCAPKETGNIISDKVIPLAINVALFLGFWITGTFWPIAIALNLAIILPGILLHPKVYPVVNTYVQKAKAIFIKPKTE